MEFTCSKCVAFESGDNKGFGECRMRPPVVMPDQDVFPLVNVGQWCIEGRIMWRDGAGGYVGKER